MCGFAGVVDFARGAVDREVVDLMAQTIAHRGPDEHGVRIDGPCALAHRRLSIVDLAASRQPMAPADSPVSLVYNGELYNYLALREGLVRAAEQLETRGDTEVILRCVARDWASALPSFDGMFAFAAWDRRGRRLLLARDPIGEKPIFYATPRKGLIVFGSEAKAVLAHPEVEQKIDLDSLRQALRFRTVYGERTLYAGVRQLSPGSFLEFDEASVRVGTYFDLVAQTRAARAATASMSTAELVRHGAGLLEQAVRERLMADVPLGLFLSGGLDSSLIAAVMRKLSPSGTLRSFSVGFRGDESSELPFARTVAEAVGAQHTEVSVGPEEFAARLAALSRFRDGPVSEPADVAVAALSRAAKEHVKVVLSGEGADEAFGGYPKYLLAKIPAVAGSAIRAIGPKRVSRMAARLGLNARRSFVAARSLAWPDELDRLTQWFSYFDRTDLSTLFPGLGWSNAQWSATADEQAHSLARANGSTAVGRMQVVDCLSWLPGNMLERGDRMTMSEGLELRPPFLDKELVTFGLSLPDHLKVRGRWTKWIVRQWATDLLPPAIHKRPKWGFRVPLAQWFRGELREMLFDHVGATNGLCGRYGDRAAIDRLLADHDSGAVDANLTLWGLLATEVWYQQLDARPARTPVEPVSATIV